MPKQMKKKCSNCSAQCYDFCGSPDEAERIEVETGRFYLKLRNISKNGPCALFKSHKFRRRNGKFYDVKYAMDNNGTVPASWAPTKTGKFAETAVQLEDCVDNTCLWYGSQYPDGCKKGKSADYPRCPYVNKRLSVGSDIARGDSLVETIRNNEDLFNESGVTLEKHNNHAKSSLDSIKEHQITLDKAEKVLGLLIELRKLGVSDCAVDSFMLNISQPNHKESFK